MTWDDLLARGDDTSGVEERMDRIRPSCRRPTSTPPDDRQPQGRRAHPPQRDVRGRLDARQRRPGGPAAGHLLPSARPHRRADPGDVLPALPRQPRARDPRPRRPARRARRGAPHGVLRRPAGLGEDQDGHLRQARGGPRPGQPGAREERDGRGSRVDAGPRVRQRDDPEVAEAYAKADEAILGFLRLLLGLDQVERAASAAAPMPLEVAKFMGGLGLRVYATTA